MTPAPRPGNDGFGDRTRFSRLSARPHARIGSPLVESGEMTGGSDPAPTEPTFIERPVLRIANARSVTLALALMFLVLAVVGAVVMRIVDQENYPTLGAATWWGLQTIT